MPRFARPEGRVAGRRPTNELPHKVLELARARTGMEVAALSRFEDGKQVIAALARDADDAGPEIGAMISPEESFGTLVLDGRLPNLIADTGTHPLARSLPIAAEYRIGSYIGVPVPGEGESPYGMLTCISRSANPTLDETDIGFLEMLAAIAASLMIGEDTSSERRRRLRDRIGRVIRQEQLTAVFQPIMALDTGRVIGAEALTRFPAEPVRPDLWFADAEAVGLGIALELAAIRKIVTHLDALPPDVYLSLNASPRTLCAPELHAAVAELPTGRVVVELTEHAAVEDYDELEAALVTMRGLGVRLAIDDVGAGFSSFTHVLRLHPDIVKLDITITRGLDQDPARRGLARGLVSVARDTGATVVAEGVETQAELDVLLDLGVDAAQGYHLARPGPLPLPTDLPRPTGRFLGGVGDRRSDGDALEHLARTWLHARDLESVARPILDAVLDRTGPQTSFVTVVDPNTGDLEHRYVRNAGTIDLPEGAVVPWDDTLCKRCREAGIRWTADVPADLPGSSAAEAFGVQTFLSIPVRGREASVVGTPCAASTEQRYIGSGTLDQIELLARLIGDRWDAGEPGPVDRGP